MPMQESTIGIGRHGDSIRWSMHCAVSEDTFDSGSTNYLPLNGPSMPVTAAFIANAHMLISRNGHIENLCVSLQTAPGAGQTVTITLMRNGLPTALQIFITGANTFGRNTTQRIRVIVGDLVCYRIVVSPGGNATRARITSEMHAYSKE